jgi:hypothetical protein
MHLHVSTASGRSLTLFLDGRRTYDDVVAAVSSELGEPARNLALYHNRRPLGQSTVFDPAAGPASLSVAAVSRAATPPLSFPPGERALALDYALFAPASVRNRYLPEVRSARERPRPQLRELVRTVGFEFGDPYSRARTIRTEARADRAAEARAVLQELAGEFDDAEAARERAIAEGLLPQCEADLSARDRAAVGRLACLGVDRDAAAFVFLAEHCDEERAFERLERMRREL